MACALTLHHPRDWQPSQHAEKLLRSHGYKLKAPQ
jgi:hypothetical protein